MTDQRNTGTTGDISFQPEPTLESVGNVDFDASIGGTGGNAAGDGGTMGANSFGDDAGAGSDAKRSTGETIKQEAGKLGTQAADKARSFAGDGKERASGAIDEFSRMMEDAATTVDEKLGEQYGQYARSAAQSLHGFADTLREKDVDELLDDARSFVRKSPAVAIGTAAALGFVLARIIKAGVDGNTLGTGGSTGSGTQA